MTCANKPGAEVGQNRRPTKLPSILVRKSEMFPWLPWELNQLIIDQFYDDKNSLLACCLVAKRAIPLCRRHLFLQMTIHLKDDRSHRWNLLQLTLRCNTRIGDFVRRLILIGATHAWYRQHCGYLAMLFPLVIQLEINNAIWIDAEIKPTMTLGGLKSVTHLLFTNVAFPSSILLQKTLSSYPQCDTLALSYSDVAPDFRTITSRVPSIRTLHLGVGEKTVIIDWILSKFQPLKVTSLTLRDITYQDSSAVGGLMHAIGDDLQRLDISFRIAPTVTEAAENIDLSQNTGLRTLIFDDWFMSRWLPTEWSPLILKRVRSRRLRTLIFHFRCPNIEFLPWDDTAPFLNRLPFPEIQLVRLENHAPLYASTFRDREYIHNIMPALAVKNLVEYVAIPEGRAKFPWNLLYEDKSLPAPVMLQKPQNEPAPLGTAHRSNS